MEMSMTKRKNPINFMKSIKYTSVVLLILGLSLVSINLSSNTLNQANTTPLGSPIQQPGETSLIPEDTEIPVYEKGLFSWMDQATDKNNRKELYSAIDTLGITDLYQVFSDRTIKSKDMPSFLADMKVKKVNLYYLMGQPEWGLDKNATEAIKAIKTVANYNDKYKDSGRFRGIVLDVEPYLTKDWDKDPSAVMETFCTSLKTAYRAAAQRDLRVIVCIPYWLDDKYSEQLKYIISRASDEVAVMNYNLSNEIPNMQKEIELAKEFNKRINCIFEFGYPGTNELTDNQTYYNKGIEPAVKNFETLYRNYKYQKLKFSFHHYRVINELLNQKEPV